MTSGKPATDADLERLQHDSFNYFLNEANPVNGLVIDKTAINWPASIAATGLALAAYPVGVERGFVSHAAALVGDIAGVGPVGRYLPGGSGEGDQRVTGGQLALADGRLHRPRALRNRSNCPELDRRRTP